MCNKSFVVINPTKCKIYFVGIEDCVGFSPWVQCLKSETTLKVLKSDFNVSASWILKSSEYFSFMGISQ
jgi:hypothetical protein